MAATQFITGFRRTLVVLLAACALVLVFAGRALAGNGNGNCDSPGHHYGLDCPTDPPPPPESPPPDSPPAGGDTSAPASDPAPGESAPPSDSPVPDPQFAPAPEPAAPPAGDPEPAAPSTAPEAAPAPPAPAPPAPAPPDPGPPAPAAGWAPVTARPESAPATPAPRPTAPRGRTFSSYTGPEASWGTPDASWSQGAQSAERFGVTGTSAIIAIRRGAGVAGGLAFRVQMMEGHSTFAFRASRSIVAGSGGRLYRIGAWLRSDVPGLSVCLRIQELTPGDSLVPVRTSESCLATTAKWKKFRLYRRTLARGNRLVFSIYSYGAVEGDSFDVDGFTVARKVLHGWKRVDAAFGNASS